MDRSEPLLRLPKTTAVRTEEAIGPFTVNDLASRHVMSKQGPESRALDVLNAALDNRARSIKELRALHQTVLAREMEQRRRLEAREILGTPSRNAMLSDLYAIPNDSPADSPQPSPRVYTAECDDAAAGDEPDVLGFSIHKLQVRGQYEPTTAPAELGMRVEAGDEADGGDDANCIALTHAAVASAGASSSGSAHITTSQRRPSVFTSGRLSRGPPAAGDSIATAMANALGSPMCRAAMPVQPEAPRQQHQAQRFRRKPRASASCVGSSASAQADVVHQVFRSSRPLFSFLQSGYGALAAEAAEAGGGGECSIGTMAAVGDDAGANEEGGRVAVDSGSSQLPELSNRGFSRASVGALYSYADEGAAGPYSADALLASGSNTGDGSALDASAAVAISARSTLGGMRSQNSLKPPTLSQRPTSRTGGGGCHGVASEGRTSAGGGSGAGGACAGVGAGVEAYPLPASPQVRRCLRPACHSSDGTSADFNQSLGPLAQPTSAIPPASPTATLHSMGSGGSGRLARLAVTTAAAVDGPAVADGGGNDGSSTTDPSPAPPRPQLHLPRHSVARPAALTLPHVQLGSADGSSSPAAGMGLCPSPPPMLQSPGMSAGGSRGLITSGIHAMPACGSPKTRQQEASRFGGWCGGTGGVGSVGLGDAVGVTPSSGGSGTLAAAGAGAVPSPRGYGGIIFLYDGLGGGDGLAGGGADTGQGDEWQGPGPSLAAAAAAAAAAFGSPRASYSGGGSGRLGAGSGGGGLTGTSSEKLIRLPANVVAASASNFSTGSTGTAGSAGCEDATRGNLSGSSGRQLLSSSSMGLPGSGPNRSRLARTERRTRPAVKTVPSLAGAGAAPVNFCENAPSPLLLPTVSGPLPPACPKHPQAASATGMGMNSSVAASATALAAPGSSRLAAAEALLSVVQPDLQARQGQR